MRAVQRLDAAMPAAVLGPPMFALDASMRSSLEIPKILPKMSITIK